MLHTSQHVMVDQPLTISNCRFHIAKSVTGPHDLAMQCCWRCSILFDSHICQCSTFVAYL